jgi:phosphoribosylanthranilate isomerase
MIVKVCGITNVEDAAVAIAAGATAIGFNFYPRSPRYITPELAALITTPPAVRRVGVFVNESRANVERIVQIAALHVAQLHGEESLDDYPAHTAVWKAARVTTGVDLSAYLDGHAEALLLDGPAGDLYGGAGKSFDWSLARSASHRIILAGGLDGTNVAAAVAAAQPWGVDSCSRIESAPGKKDHKKMTEFLQAAREALHL